MATSEAGNAMYPVSWKEYKDPETGASESRKVAKPFQGFSYIFESQIRKTAQRRSSRGNMEQALEDNAYGVMERKTTKIPMSTPLFA